MSSQRKISALSNEQIAYIRGCSILQCAVWRITHRDPLSAIHSKISSYILREAILLLVNIREKRTKSILRRALEKWLKICKALRGIEERKKTLLKLLFVGKEAKMNSIKAKYLQKWKSATSVSEAEILDKYGSLFKLLEYIKNASLRPIEKNFMDRLRAYRNLEKLKKPAKKLFGAYSKAQRELLKSYLNKWNKNSKDAYNLLLKRRVLSLATVSAIKRSNQAALHKALKNWYENALMDDYLQNQRANAIFSIYGKWKKINRINDLYSALLTWRKNAVKDDSAQNKILNAKKHMLKHNINKNAEDLLKAMQFIHLINKRRILLKKLLAKNKKFRDSFLRKNLKKWLDQANKLKNKDLLKSLRLNFLLKLKENKEKNFDNELLRKALYIWNKNTRTPKTILPNTEKAANLIRKATTEPFFQKLKEKIQNSVNKEKFKYIIRAIILNNEKDFIHWWFCQWRKNARALSKYNLRAHLIKQFIENQEKQNKLRGLRNLKERIQNLKNNDATKLKLIRGLFLKLNALSTNDNKAKLQRALYLWRSKCGDIRSPYDQIKPYKDGAKILQRFCWRTTHPDILHCFDAKISGKAIDLLLSKILRNLDRNNRRNLLRKYLYTWKSNSREPVDDKRLKRLFKRYLKSGNIRKKLYAPYKDLVDFMNEYYGEKKDAAKAITEYVKAIKDLPKTVRKMKIILALKKILLKYTGKDKLLHSKFMEWRRRARNYKSDNDAKIIEKFIRDRLRKRLDFKLRIENGIEFTKLYIYRQIFNRIKDFAEKNKIPDILMKYFLKREADDMKNLIVGEIFYHF